MRRRWNENSLKSAFFLMRLKRLNIRLNICGLYYQTIGKMTRICGQAREEINLDPKDQNYVQG